MFQKVSTQEIKNIKERLNLELSDKDLSLQRREEVASLLSYISTWLEWRDYQKPVKPSGTMIAQRDYFKPLKNVGVFKKGERV